MLKIDWDKIILNENKYWYKTYTESEQLAKILSKDNIKRLLDEDDYKAIREKLLDRNDEWWNENTQNHI